MTDDWSLKGRYGLLDNGKKIWTNEDIETLREKLIEDIYAIKHLSNEDKFILKMIIQKRFE